MATREVYVEGRGTMILMQEPAGEHYKPGDLIKYDGYLRRIREIDRSDVEGSDIGVLFCKQEVWDIGDCVPCFVCEKPMPCAAKVCPHCLTPYEHIDGNYPDIDFLIDKINGNKNS